MNQGSAASFPKWARRYFGAFGVFATVMAIWSPYGEPWWWRLLFVAWVAVVAYAFGSDRG